MSKLSTTRHEIAKMRPELRMSSSPRQAENPAGTFTLKVQRTPEVDAAMRRYEQEQLP